MNCIVVNALEKMDIYWLLQRPGFQQPTGPIGHFIRIYRDDSRNLRSELYYGTYNGKPFNLFGIEYGREVGPHSLLIYDLFS